MAIFRYSIILLLTLAAAQGAQDRFPVDWSRVDAETLQHFLALLRIDTSSPPGNETVAARYLRSALQREGITGKLFAKDPSRANLVARIRGNGSKPPLLVMGHTDVVGVQRERWSVAPFAGIRKGGFIYGRGAQDDKPHVTAGLMLLLLLKRLHVPLDRDVIFLAEAGEEGNVDVGIDFMVQHHWNEIQAEYALAEGGSMVQRDGKVRYAAIATAEKVPRGVRLIARGTAGHGSRPTPDNAVVSIANAVARVGAWQTPIRLNQTTRTYFERLAGISSPEEAARYQGILDPARAPAIDRWFSQHELMHYSILRTSVSPTMLKAGFRANVIPSEAEAYLDVRALPDEDMDRFCDELRRVIGDASVQVIPPAKGGRPAAPPSSTGNEMFRALEQIQRRLYPGAITIPVMMTGATDMAQLRARGVQAYGFGPVVDRREGGAHADDERLLETSLYGLVRFLWYTVLEMAASSS